MVFKRRDKRSWLRLVWEVIYPKGGWTRAFHYVTHRVRRLPDSPERIARGVFIGVFASFTPFYGLHFLISFILARVMNANLLSSMLATFFGNPLTYVPIAYASLKTGYWLTGIRGEAHHVRHSIGEMFTGAAHDLWTNLRAVFTGQNADWTGLAEFYADVFYPYMVGCVLPGIITGLVCYYISVPLIRAYQKRRNKGVLKARLARLKATTVDRSSKNEPEKS